MTTFGTASDGYPDTMSDSNTHSSQDEPMLGASAPQSGSSTEKDPEDWVTGDEPMTGPQRSYLQTLAQEAKQEVPDDLTKAEASEAIDHLQQETGRGRG